MPKLINLEGLDATGKHTVAIELQKILKDCGSVCLTDFPVYDTPTGKMVKEFLNGNVIGDPKIVDGNIGSLYYTVDRITFFRQHLEELAKADFIISDRSYLSNFIFQGSKLVPIKLCDTDMSGLASKYARELSAFMDIQDILELQMSGLANILSPRDIFSFYLYHKSIDTNMILMNKRNRERDLNENKDYLVKVHEFAYSLMKILENTYSTGYYTQMIAKHPAYFYTGIECSDTDDSGKLILFEPKEIASNICDEIFTKNHDKKKYIYSVCCDSLNALYRLKAFTDINT